MQFKLSIIVIFCCALAVVYTSYVNRQLAQQWQVLGETHNTLQEQYGRLMLEYSTLAAPSRVEVFAREKMNMVFPNKNNTRVIQLNEQ